MTAPFRRVPVIIACPHCIGSTMAFHDDLQLHCDSDGGCGVTMSARQVLAERRLSVASYQLLVAREQEQVAWLERWLVISAEEAES